MAETQKSSDSKGTGGAKDGGGKAPAAPGDRTAQKGSTPGGGGAKN
ncbi:MAG: hypothetical protein ABL909_00610 [Sphingopyxis sp.]